MNATPGLGITHHEHCWTYHLDCANEEIVRLRNRLAAVRALANQIDAELDALPPTMTRGLGQRVTVRIREAMGEPT